MTLPLPDMYKTGADIKKRLVRLEQPIAEAKSVENSAGASVTVAMQPDGKLKYSFSIPKGLKGDTGATGPAGPQGVPGKPGTTSWNDITEKPDFITKSTADITYLGIKGKAESAKIADKATTADSATKATQDAAGNVIASHYATKTEVSKKLDSSAAFTKVTADTLYLGKTAKAESAKTADTSKDAIKKSGDRSVLAGYESIGSIASATTINNNSPDDQVVTGAVKITIADGTTKQTWQKNIVIKNAGASIAPGSKWKWIGGSAPEVKANSLLVCKWSEDIGFLSLAVTE